MGFVFSLQVCNALHPAFNNLSHFVISLIISQQLTIINQSAALAIRNHPLAALLHKGDLNRDAMRPPSLDDLHLPLLKCIPHIYIKLLILSKPFQDYKAFEED